MRELIDGGDRSGLWLLPTVMGLLTTPSAALSIAAVVEGRDALIWIVTAALSVLGFWIYVYVYGYAYRLIGGWFGAGGTNASGRLALSWTQAPFILIWVVVMPLQIVYRNEFFPEIDVQAVMGGSTEELYRLLDVEHSVGYSVTKAILYLGYLAAWVWSLFVLGAALECPAWKAGLVKIMALLLHIPIFIVCAIPAFIIAVGIAIWMAPG